MRSALGIDSILMRIERFTGARIQPSALDVLLC